MAKKNRNYSVGYCVPPDHTKVKPGQVLNPNGRRGKHKKGEKDFWALVLEELERRVPVSLNGKRTKESPSRLGATQFARKIAEGDPRAIKELLANMRHLGTKQRESASDGTFETPAHQLTMENIVRRIRFMDPPTGEQSQRDQTWMEGAGI